MVYLDIILKSLGILSLIAFMIILIWGFVVFNGIYSQMRYTNYLLEKISHIINIQEKNIRLNEKFTSKGEESEIGDKELKEDSTSEIPDIEE